MGAQVSGNFKALWIRGDNLYDKGWRIPHCADADVGRLELLIGLICMVCRDMCEINGCYCFKHYQQGWTGTQKQPTEFPLNQCFSTGGSRVLQNKSLVWEKSFRITCSVVIDVWLHTPSCSQTALFWVGRGVCKVCIISPCWHGFTYRLGHAFWKMGGWMLQVE